MPSGADIHVVRIWNDSGDVSQGQGPYATDLVLAYDNCLTYLIEQQKTDKNAKMVINMSYGSAGPLTVERLWIKRAAKRGDMLFVGSAGNNGTYLTSTVPYKSEQQLSDPGQYLSYPASYNLDEVRSAVSVEAQLRCAVAGLHDLLCMLFLSRTCITTLLAVAAYKARSSALSTHHVMRRCSGT